MQKVFVYNGEIFKLSNIKMSKSNTSARGLIEKFHEISKAKEYASLKLFQSLTSSRVPLPDQTFYIRLRSNKSVYEIARDTSTGQLSRDQSVQIRSFIPWDRCQLWCFVPFQNGAGLLFHPESSQYLTVVDGQLKWKFSYDYLVDESDCFKYTSAGHWVHINSGFRLSYVSSCGMGPGHEQISTRYDFDVIPSFDVLSGLLSKGIFWSSTNAGESLRRF